MKHKKNILLFILIISTLSLILLPNIVKGSIADIHYEFENDVLYNSQNIYSTDTFNLRNTQTYTKFYNASYSFTNNTNGNNPLYFNSDESGGSIEVNASIVNHDKVVEYIDDGNNVLVELDYELISEVSGSYEFWIRFSQTNKDIFHYIMDTSILHAINLNWAANGDLRYYDGAWHVIDTYISNKWYHISIDFECSGGAYLGLGADTFNIRVNDVIEGSGVSMRGNPTSMDIIRWRSKSFDSGILYLDAIGYSWLSNYSIGENIIPEIIINTDIYEINKFEFGFIDVNTLYPDFTSNVETWTDIEIGGADQVFTRQNPAKNDGWLFGAQFAVADERGITKVFDVNGEFVNISAEIGFIDLVGVVNYYVIVIYPKDELLNPITMLRFKANGDLDYFNGGWINLRNDVAVLVNYSINLFINYETERVKLRYTIDGVLGGIYDYNVNAIVSSEQGIERVSLYSFGVDVSQLSYFLDNVGVYSEGISLAMENEIIGYQVIDLNTFQNWNFENNNLFSMNGSGKFHIGAVSGSYEVGETFGVVNTFTSYTGSAFFNIYDNGIGDLSNPSIVLTIKDVNYYMKGTDILIEGCKLTQDSNEYFLEYVHSGIETNTSYFYVDNDNKLQFTLISNDTNTEYIQAIFNISDVSSTDKGISFRGYRTNKAYGYFVVDYLAGLTTVEIPLIEKTTRAILPLNKTIDSFIILITDNDQDIILGATTGYISQPILLNVLGLGLPITTAGLIEMMIPLLLIIVPTLLISKGFGKEGKKLLIPLFLIFSLIATATFIIPVWIFFIIAFGTGLFLFRNKEIESEI